MTLSRTAISLMDNTKSPWSGPRNPSGVESIHHKASRENDVPHNVMVGIGIGWETYIRDKDMDPILRGTILPKNISRDTILLKDILRVITLQQDILRNTILPKNILSYTIIAKDILRDTIVLNIIILLAQFNFHFQQFFVWSV